MRKLLVPVLVGFLCAVSAPARDHKDFNGAWTLVQGRSDFAGQPVVQTGTVTIEDRQGNISVSRSFAYEGATETFFYKDMTDSQRGATIHAGKDVKSKTRWDRDDLKVTTTDGGAVTTETYRLTGENEMTVTVMRPDQKSITLVFLRK
jgi:hypothetical protein